MYKERTLKFEFDVGSGSFDSAGNTKLSISDVKALAKVSYMGNIGGTMADVTLYGLGIELIAMLSAKGIGASFNATQAIGMNIYADGTLIFSGGIFSCYANMNSIPEAALIINAAAGLDLSRTATKPYTSNGKAAVADIIKAIATPNGYTAQTYGLDGIYGENAHFIGSPLEQIRELCSWFDFLMAINGKTITVWKRTNGINTIIAKVSPENGLIGYPVFTQSGITYQAVFSPYLAAGQQAQIETSLPNASGTYMNYAVDHYLSSWVPNGPWSSICQASKITASKPNVTN